MREDEVKVMVEQLLPAGATSDRVNETVEEVLENFAMPIRRGSAAA